MLYDRFAVDANKENKQTVNKQTVLNKPLVIDAQFLITASWLMGMPLLSGISHDLLLLRQKSTLT